MRPELYGDFLLIQRLAESATAESLIGVRLGDRSGRSFVVKRPRLGERTSGSAAQSIAREAEVLAAVRAPGLAALEASGEIAGLPYVVTEHVRGATLEALLARGSLPDDMTAAIAQDLANALAALHDAGWVHGDVTPSNVIVDDAGEARLLDLGIAERVGTTTATLSGKRGYVAPEAVRGVAVAASRDVYAWGTLVAECAIGAPLHADRELTDAASRPDVTTRRGDLGAHADAILEALRRDVDSRPTARDLAVRLRAAPVDRAGLAERVADAQAEHELPPRSIPDRHTADAPEPRPVPAPSTALTPTTPMALPRPAPTVVDAADEDDDPGTPVRGLRRLPPAPRPPRPGFLGPLLVALGGALILALAGWRLARPRHATLALASPLPKRSVLEVDGKPTMAPDVGGSLSLSPGRHLLTLVLPRNERRDYSIDVRTGDRILVFPLLRGSAGAAYEGRDP